MNKIQLHKNRYRPGYTNGVCGSLRRELLCRDSSLHGKYTNNAPPNDA